MTQNLKQWFSEQNKAINSYVDGEKIYSESCQAVDFNLASEDKINVAVYKVDENIVQKIGNVINPINEWNDLKARKSFFDQLRAECKAAAEDLTFLESNSTDSSLRMSRKKINEFLQLMESVANREVYNFASSKAQNYRQVVVIGDKQSVIEILSETVIPSWLEGYSCTVLVEPNTKSIQIAYFVYLCMKAQLPTSLLSYIVTDVIKAEERRLKPFVALIFDGSDIHSAANHILELYLSTANTRYFIAFVQQSIHAKFVARLNDLAGRLVVGNKFDQRSDVSEKVILVERNFDKTSDGLVISLFRTPAEALTLINHFESIHFLSMWSERPSLFLEFSLKLRSCNKISINSMQHVDVISSRIESFKEAADVSDRDRSIFENTLKEQSKWKAESKLQRLSKVNNFTIDCKLLSASNLLILQSEDDSLTQRVKESTFLISINEPLGILVIQTNEVNENVWMTILKAIALGNAVIILSQNSEFSTRQNLENFGIPKNIMQVTNKLNIDFRGNITPLRFNEEIVGLAIQNIDNISLKHLSKTKHILLPYGEINCYQ